VAARVTRLGEWSLINRLFTLGNGLKIAEAVQNFGQLFIAFDKKSVGLHFG
jgi:hypothetical protein